MKKQEITVLVSVYDLDTSARFEKRVSDEIKKVLIGDREIYISDAGMRGVGGYGQYKEYVNISIDGEEFELTKHSTSAPDFDLLSSAEGRIKSNFLKNLIIDVISDNDYKIEERMMEVDQENAEDE